MNVLDGAFCLCARQKFNPSVKRLAVVAGFGVVSEGSDEHKGSQKDSIHREDFCALLHGASVPLNIQVATLNFL